MLLVLAIVLLGAAALLAAAVPVGSIAFARGGAAAQIAWIESLRQWLPWGALYDGDLDALYRRRVEDEIRAGRLDQAVVAMRTARLRERRLARPHDSKLVDLGLEAYARATERLERGGRLAAAADWCDTLFVFAVREPDAHAREEAVVAFLRGLDLRVRAGDPCGAASRIEWAKRGLGGEVPGLDARTEEDVLNRCAKSRRSSRGSSR